MGEGYGGGGARAASHQVTSRWVARRQVGHALRAQETPRWREKRVEKVGLGANKRFQTVGGG